MNFSVRTSENAVQDLEAIVDFISQDNPTRARSFVDEIIRHYEKNLSSMPRKFSAFEGKLPLRLMKYQGKIRKLVFKKTVLIYFLIDDENREILVLHIKRTPKPLEHS